MSLTDTDAGRRCRQSSWVRIDVDRSRGVSFGRTGRKAAPILVPDGLTVKMTVKFCDAAASPLSINNFERSLMIEWE